ncbi:hypothetical protein BN1013_00380 [Candidatus Rubidus massiliensis]|nr:hypothetical protein BN1013_00380 [Candidatus Rubidus massiliensis]
MDGPVIPANAEKMQGNQKFQKGRSGNPKGKIKGTRNKATLVAEQLLQGELETICRRLVQEAVEGNMQAIKMVLDRLLPPKRNIPVAIDLPKLENSSDALDAIAYVTMAVSRGNLSIDEGESLSRMIEVYVRAMEAHDYETRLSKIEQKRLS